MDFFDKLGQKASETYKYTAQKTSKLAKEAKLKMAMNEEKEKIEHCYHEIGKKVYENHIREEKQDLQQVLQEACERIDTMASKVEKYRKEILELRDRKQCKNCYEEIEADANYCPNCGYEQVLQNKTKEQTKQQQEIIEIVEESGIDE